MSTGGEQERGIGEQADVAATVSTVMALLSASSVSASSVSATGFSATAVSAPFASRELHPDVRASGRRVVAVDGPSGSGKSTLARALAQAWGAPLVATDEMIPGWDGLAAAADLLTDQVLRPFLRGEPAGYRRWDWHRSDWAERVEVPSGQALVVEGCGCTVRPADGYAQVKVWVEADLTTRLRRGLERDGESYRPHWQRWAAQERALYTADGTRDRADVILWTGAGPHQPESVLGTMV